MSKNKAKKFKDKHSKYEDKPLEIAEDFQVKLSMWYFD